MSPRSALRRRLSTALSIGAVMCGWLVVTAIAAPPASAACAARTNNSISGLVAGQDHRDINAQISFDVVDRAGRHIGPDGCAHAGYYKTMFFNPTLSARGWARDAVHPNTWVLGSLPANATGVWIELWTHTNTGTKACPTCTGSLDTTRYGFVNRRNIRIGSRNVRLIAPLNCRVDGGTSGAIQGWLRTPAGKAGRATSIYAWSELTPDGSKPFQGWGHGIQYANGYYKIDNLASGQNYALWISSGGKTYKRLHLPVRACTATLATVTV